jgi:hypothetical protein
MAEGGVGVGSPLGAIEQQPRRRLCKGRWVVVHCEHLGHEGL